MFLLYRDKPSTTTVSPQAFCPQLAAKMIPTEGKLKVLALRALPELLHA